MHFYNIRIYPLKLFVTHKYIYIPVVAGFIDPLSPYCVAAVQPGFVEVDKLFACFSGGFDLPEISVRMCYVILPMNMYKENHMISNDIRRLKQSIVCISHECNYVLYMKSFHTCSAMLLGLPFPSPLNRPCLFSSAIRIVYILCIQTN